MHLQAWASFLYLNCLFDFYVNCPLKRAGDGGSLLWYWTPAMIVRATKRRREQR